MCAKNSKDKNNFYLKYGKRLFDFIFSLLGISFLSPFFFILAILLKLDSKGPVFFLQKRISKDLKEFNLIKFRTMIPNAQKLGPSITSIEDPRITKIGKILRKWKIDEFPQLINVLKGDISIVGPRPEIKKYVYYYLKDYEKILKIKPGITDYAALKFRNEEKYLKKYENVEKIYLNEVLPMKIAFYKKYIEEIGFITDLKIIFATLGKIFSF